LHCAARSGSAPAVAALLRLDADPAARNDEGQLPRDVAQMSDHLGLVALLQRAEGDPQCAQRHPDGLGVLAEPPSGVIFTGLHESESLRRAVNMAAGCRAVPPVPISRALQEAGTGDRAVNVVRGSLQGTAFDIEDVRIGTQRDADAWLAATEDSGREAAVEVCGLLLHEPAGRVSPDSPGHWAALKRRELAGEEEAAEAVEFWRLDPVRGSYRVAPHELAQLLGRYGVWRVVRRPSRVCNACSDELSVGQHGVTAHLQAQGRQAPFMLA